MADLSESLSVIDAAFREIATRIDRPDANEAFRTLEAAINHAAEAFSGSWLGYHSRVYYNGLDTPPAGDHFSPEWGMMNVTRDTRGDWVEYTYRDIYDHLKSQTTGLGLDELVELANSVGDEFSTRREELISIFSAICEGSDDEYLLNLYEKAKKTNLYDVEHFVKRMQPHGQFFSRDMVAMTNGFQTPPHIYLLAQVQAVKDRRDSSIALARIASQAASHLARRRSAQRDARTLGDKVFIGHGRSHAWRDLKDFIQDRLDLPWDEFNRVPVAGVTNIARLSQMLDQAGVAFLVMTAEDEQQDGKMHARMNVVHEAGLFQGKLGFTRAIVVLEQGCEEFSNIQGLGQIRFPAGNISAVFEDIRMVLEREDMLPDNSET